MRIFRNLHNLPRFNKAVLTIGTFDGVHVGHQHIINSVNTLAQEVGGESILLTFHPHPRTIVHSNYSIQLLSPLEEKFELLQQYGINNVVVVPFTRDFSQQSPTAYVSDFLVKNFAPSKIVIGYNHKFGKNRAGNLTLLSQMGTKYGFAVEEISKQQVEDIAISSTKIRNALQAGKVAAASRWLGHKYHLHGVVVKGQQLGKKIGFPTANILLNDSSKLVPANGVYAVTVHLDKQVYKGMLNIGVRPTVSGLGKTIEVNMFNFDRNIYGERIKITLVQYLRAEHKFANLPALVAQLNKDKIAALSCL